MSSAIGRLAGWPGKAPWPLVALVGLVCIGLGATSASAAEERALELVNPPESRANIRAGAAVTTPDGQTTCFATEDVLLGSTPNGQKSFDDAFCSRLTSKGWVTEWVSQPAPRAIDNGGVNGAQVWRISDDGERAIFTSDAGIVPDFRGGRPDEAQRYGNVNSFLRDGLFSGSAETHWLTPTKILAEETRALLGGDPLAGNLASGRYPQAVTPDMKYGLFESSVPLLPEAVGLELDVAVYRWGPEGLKLVSLNPSNGHALRGRVPTNKAINQLMANPGAMSDDGSRIFFHHAPYRASDARQNFRRIYMWENGDVVNITPGLPPGSFEPGEPDDWDRQDRLFNAATPDGRYVLFSTAERMTSVRKTPYAVAIYRYDVETGATEMVVGGETMASVEFIGASRDGSTILYATTGFPREVWVNRNGVAEKLGQGSPLEANDARHMVLSSNPDGRALRISDDGEVIVFQSRGAYGGESPQPILQEKDQVYRWVAGEGITRISARPAGGPPGGIANFTNAAYRDPDGAIKSRYDFFNAARVAPSLGRGMTEDGQRVFFDTTEALVPEDVNGVADVYEWEDGEVSLISPGTQRYDAVYHDSSADGETVFFLTRSRLIPELDKSTGRSLYVARVGGGFPLPEEVVPCSGSQDECQGPDGVAPGTRGIGSASVDRDGNVIEPTEEARPRLRLARAVRFQGRSGRLRVRVSGPGRVRLTGPGLRPVARRVKRAGAVALPVRLKPQVRRGGVRRVTVRFTASEGTAVSRKVKARFAFRAKRAKKSAVGSGVGLRGEGR